MNAVRLIFYLKYSSFEHPNFLKKKQRVVFEVGLVQKWLHLSFLEKK